VAKPIPKIKADRCARTVHAGSRHQARGAGSKANLSVGELQHGMSPNDGGSLLEACRRIQSVISMARGYPRLSVEICLSYFDNDCRDATVTALTLAAAQSLSIAGDVRANLQRHLTFMRVAAEHAVQLLVFPELSLTGYEPCLAAELAITPEDKLLAPLREMARELRLTAVVGMPIRLAPEAGVMIGALVLGADGSLAVYTKQHLHPGEETAFIAGQGGAVLEWVDDRIALAVCADFSHASHPHAAAEAGATVYAAGVLISEAGYATDSTLLQGYAAKHGLLVLMANHGGPSGGYVCAGRSAIWAAGGRLLAAAPGVGDALVLARREGGEWAGQVVVV
jgi:predicted amidohydrolase